MAMLEVLLPPGVYANGTARQARGRINDSQLTRAPNGTDFQPVGGWLQKGSDSVDGLARAIIAWKANSGSKWAAIGTHSKLYAMTPSGVLHDITPSGFTAGQANATLGGGYGAGPYGAGPYGTPRPDGADITPASVWALDTFGQNLVGCLAADGKLYMWQRDTGTPAAAISGAPTGNAGLVVTAEGFIFALKGRTVAWCDQRVETTWTPSSTNQAGDLDLDTAGNLICGRRVEGGTLLFTDSDVWLAEYQGQPTIYGFRRVGADCGIVAVGAATSIDSRCVWMGRKSFFQFNGSTVPLSCDVADKVFSDFNSQQASKVTSYHNTQHGEVWWFYPSSASNENDRYVFWSYRLNCWWVGALARTAGVGSAPGIFAYPLLVDPDGAVYEHELGFDWAGSEPYILTFPIEWPGNMGFGDQRIMIAGFWADELQQGGSEVSFLCREGPNEDEFEEGPFAIDGAPIDCLFTTKQVAMKIAFSAPRDSRIGNFRIDVQPVSTR